MQLNVTNSPIWTIFFHWKENVASETAPKHSTTTHMTCSTKFLTDTEKEARNMNRAVPREVEAATENRRERLQGKKGLRRKGRSRGLGRRRAQGKRRGVRRGEEEKGKWRARRER